MTEKSDKSEYAKNYIAEINKRINSGFQDLRQERLKMNQWEWENDSEFTVMGLIELYTSDLCGYSSQIASNGKVRYPQNAAKNLRKTSFFDKPHFVEWYFSPDNNYPKLKKYAESLDYLRYLCLEYVTRYQNNSGEDKGEIIK